MDKRKGQCLCGHVSIEIEQDITDIGVCHCSMCRTWNGGPMQALHVGPNIVLHGDEHIGVYQSSDWAERAFCKSCGTNLFYHVIETGDYYVSAGLFRDVEGFEITQQIFIDEKPDFYTLANDTPTLTGQQVFEMFSDANKDDE